MERVRQTLRHEPQAGQIPAPPPIIFPLQGSGRIPSPSLSTNSILFIITLSKILPKKKAVQFLVDLL